MRNSFLRTMPLTVKKLLGNVIAPSSLPPPGQGHRDGFDPHEVAVGIDPELRRYFNGIARELKLCRGDRFPDVGAVAWLDKPDFERRIGGAERIGALTDFETSLCRSFAEDGFVIVEDLIDPRSADVAWDDYMTQISSGLDPRESLTELDSAWGSAQDVHKSVPAMDALFHHSELTKYVTLLLGKPCLPFQTIASCYGSEQAVHADAIHMTTYPLGFFAAAHIALEDVHEDAGPLVCYPGSHRLPYVLSESVGIASGEQLRSGRSAYTDKYEPAVRELVEVHGLEPRYHTPRKGDVLIMHQNLLHGHTKINDPARTSRSLICHYYAKGAFCYHDLYNRPADLAMGYGDARESYVEDPLNRF